MAMGMIYSESVMVQFLNSVLCSPGVYMGYVQSRSKYGATRDAMLTKTSFRFDVGKHSIERIISIITSAVADSVKDAALASSSVVYVTTNPRDEAEAEHKLLSEILEHRYHRSTSGERCPDWGSRWNSLLTSSSDSSIRNDEMWWTIDIDLKEVTELDLTLDQLHAVLKPEDVTKVREESWVVTTRGGWHVLIRGKYLSKAAKSKLHTVFSPRKFTGKDRNGKEIQKSVVTIKPDVNCPIPGTAQGGHPVTFCLLLKYTCQ